MFKSCTSITVQKAWVNDMCEFTVYLDGHEDSDIVATSVVKSIEKPEYIALMDTAGKVTKVPNARVVKVDTIMTELILKSCVI